MITSSGKQVFPLDSDYYTGEVPTITDIAQGLGRIPRFAGQVNFFYPVLLHSLVAAEVCDEQVRLHMLLHDATEAIISDIPSTWKREQTKRDEAALLFEIYRSLGIKYPSSDELDLIRQADAACLAAEAHALGHAQAERWWPRDSWNSMTEDAYVLTSRLVNLAWPVQVLNLFDAGAVYSQEIRLAEGNSVLLREYDLLDRMKQAKEGFRFAWMG